MSFVIELSKLKIQIMSDSEYVKRRCSAYLSTGIPNMTARASKDEIDNEKKLSPGFSDDYYEFVCLYRSICMKMPEYDRLLFHSAVIDAGGRGYAFAARSGTGKTTHIRLWKECFGDVNIINGDKPIIEMRDNDFYASGSPWCGKENYNMNREAKLNGIVFLERGEVNEIKKLEAKEAADRAFKQIIIPKDAYAAAKTLDLLDKMLRNVPIFELRCNINPSAAVCARNFLDSL